MIPEYWAAIFFLAGLAIGWYWRIVYTNVSTVKENLMIHKSFIFENVKTGNQLSIAGPADEYWPDVFEQIGVTHWYEGEYLHWSPLAEPNGHYRIKMSEFEQN